MDFVLPNNGILLPAQTTLGDVWITEGDFLCYTYDNQTLFVHSLSFVFEYQGKTYEFLDEAVIPCYLFMLHLFNQIYRTRCKFND